MTHYCPSAGIDGLREAAAAYFARTRGLESARSTASSAPARSRSSSSRCSRSASPATRSSTPARASRSTSRRSGSPAPRRCRCRSATRTTFVLDPERLRAALSPRTKLVILNSPHNPTGGALDAGGGRRRRAGARGDRRVDLQRRGVFAAPVRLAVPKRREHAESRRPHARARRALEDLCDDRLALRLRGRSRAARRAARPLLRQLDLVRAAVRPARRDRGARRAAGVGRGDAPGVRSAGARSSSTG